MAANLFSSCPRVFRSWLFTSICCLPVMCILPNVAIGNGPEGAVSEAPAESPEYNRVVRPILSDNCFPCHGPDASAREADLRLDQPEQAYRDDVVVPGDPAASEVMRRLISDDDDERMPPPDSQKQVTRQQIELIRRWIAGGANYTQHWAFVPPVRPDIPRHAKSKWPRNPIDHFVLEAIRSAGLQPSVDADRYTLVRRVYLDLIGIPPTPEQADAFANDPRPRAYEFLVDRLLSTPHYGERWARRWLDLARYSDTNGYEKDRPRTMWPYRDWVINALNQDMPFDQFTIEQIAGDLLPQATLSQRIATGFHRNTMINEEGGIDPQEFRYLAIVDRLATTGTAWLGLTLKCARCHSHKFDPVSQTEYYRLFDLMNNADETTLEVPTAALKDRRAEIVREISQLQDALAGQFPIAPPPSDSDSNEPEHGGPESGATETKSDNVSDARETARNESPSAKSSRGDGQSPATLTGTAAGRHELPLSDKNDPTDGRRNYLDQRFAEWLDRMGKEVVSWHVLHPQTVESNLPSTDIMPDHSVYAGGDRTKNDRFTVTFSSPRMKISAIRLEALPDARLPEGGPGRRVVGQGASAGVGDFFLTRFACFVTGTDQEDVELPLADASESFAAANRSADQAIDGKTDTGWSIAGRPGERHVAVFRLHEPVTLTNGQKLRVRLEHESFYPSGLGRFRLSVTSDTRNVNATDTPVDIEAALLASRGSGTDVTSKDRLMDYFLSLAPELDKQHQAIAALRAQLPKYPKTLVMQERPARHRRSTHRHHRGEFLQSEEVVEAGVPEFLHPLRSGEPPSRLALARWLVDRDNPLVARVVVNRQWQALFGRGIVRTLGDFGSQGSPPSHPKLLDWLAVEFMERGWSLKKLHRLMVLSSTYRQSAVVTEEAARVDPENLWLSRAPRIRLDAELIRDAILHSAGKLSKKIGGPSVFPQQPPGITEAAYGPLKWTLSQGEDRYRRGLYTFSKRTSPYVAFGLFDAPSGEACIAGRVNSNTPLQALNLLNDTVVMEAAQFLARDVIKNADTTSRRAVYLFRRCLTRPPDADELRTITRFYQQQLAHFTRSEASPLPIVGGAVLKTWSFTDDRPVGWTARHECDIEVKDGKLHVISTGKDPAIRAQVAGPPGNCQLTIRARFPAVETGQVFWTTSKDPTESARQMASFDTVAGTWETYLIPLKLQGDLVSLRLDPGTRPGRTVIEQLRLTYGTTAVPIAGREDQESLAAWVLVARAMMNLDEFVTKP